MTTMRGFGWSFRFKFENNITLVNEKYVALLQDAESQLVANVPAGTDESSVFIRTLSHTRFVDDTVHRTKLETGTASTEPKRFEIWIQLVLENAPKTAGRRFAMLQAVLQPGIGRHSGKVRGSVECVGTPGGRLREIGDVKAQ